MITINSVFKYIDIENGERIRIVEIIENNIYVVNIDAVTSMPKKEEMKKLEEEIETEKLIKIKDPFAKVIYENKLSENQISKRNESWEFIDKYLEENKLDLLNKSKRNNTIKKISEETGYSLTTVKKIFSRYWQRGMNKNALLPDYINSGGKGKEKKLGDAKIGRPKKADYYGEYIEGINITDDVKKGKIKNCEICLRYKIIKKIYIE